MSRPNFTLLMLLSLLIGRSSAFAQLQPEGQGRSDSMPEEFKNVGIDENGGALVPLDLTFQDETGKTVRLGDYFKTGHPVVLQLGYFGCPMLCGLVSQGMVQSLKQTDLEMGKDFDAIFLSIDPSDDAKVAYLKKRSFVEEYDQPSAAAGWHFLVGAERPIHQIADALGFRYKWVENAKQFAHPAVLMICTPDGHISRYLYGVKYDPKTVRLSLVEASEGKIGTTLDRIMLICFHYDGATGKYALAAIALMRVGGLLTIIILGIMLWRMNRWRRPVRIADPASTAGLFDDPIQ